MKLWPVIFTVAVLLGACSATNPEGTRSGDCTDGVDNDGDGKIDCGDDGCEVYTSCKKVLEPRGSGLLSAQVKAAAEKKKAEESIE